MRRLLLLFCLLLCTSATVPRMGRRDFFHMSSRSRSRGSRVLQIRGGASSQRTDVVNRFGPLGTIEQIDNAHTAVGRSSPIAAIATNAGRSAVMFGWVQQKDDLLDENVPLGRVIQLSPTLAAMATGLQGDCRLVHRWMLDDVADFVSLFGVDPDAEYVANNLARRLQDRTMSSQRPLATHVLVASVHAHQLAQIFSVALSGQLTQVKAHCAGSGQEQGLQVLQRTFEEQQGAGGVYDSENSKRTLDQSGAKQVLQYTLRAMQNNSKIAAGTQGNATFEEHWFTLAG